MGVAAIQRPAEGVRIGAAALGCLIGGYPLLVLAGVEYLAVVLYCFSGLLFLIWSVVSSGGSIRLPLVAWTGGCLLVAGVVYSYAGHNQALFYIVRDVTVYMGPLGLYLLVRGFRPSERRLISRSAVVLLLANGCAAVLLLVWGRPLAVNTIFSISALSQRTVHNFSSPDLLLGVAVARPAAFLSFATSLSIAALVFVAACRPSVRPYSFLIVSLFGLLAITRTVFVIGIAGLLLITAGRRVRRLGRLVIALGYLGVAVLVTSALSGDSSVGESVVARGANSTAARSAIYEATIAYWVNFNSRFPFGGLGNPVELSSVPYPLGSHSMYLGTLFRFGALGLAGVLLVLLALMTLAARSSLGGTAWVCSILIVFIVEDVTLDPLNWLGVFLALGLFAGSVSEWTGPAGERTEVGGVRVATS